MGWTATALQDLRQELTAVDPSVVMISCPTPRPRSAAQTLQLLMRHHSDPVDPLDAHQGNSFSKQFMADSAFGALWGGF
ncbi:hypothetical protein NQZ68_014756 [Dissostichus eleginoides]|nr:hypothetical protein NQZ68_014756 [Dissostichus eleginoides]